MINDILGFLTYIENLRIVPKVHLINFKSINDTF